MFLFKKHKKISHKQAAIIGFVLAVMSLLTTGVVGYLVPLFQAWMASNGVYTLDVFLLLFAVTVFFSVQGLLLFGFPLFYAQDKKSHMTGFQILIYALMWMMAIVLLIGFVSTLI